MIIIAFQFTAGRYHATPWARHVNEGVTEWPPSPWRILRSLVSVWYHTIRGEYSESILESIIHKLAGRVEFYLPPATESHTRHYMPIIESKKEKKTLIFDTFVIVDRDKSVVAVWPDAELTQEETQCLALLLERMPYLGRAESWVKASLTGSVPAFNCSPLPDAQEAPDGFDIIRVLCPEENLPIDDLIVETSRIRKQKKNPLHPPGTRWIPYARKTDCFARSLTFNSCPKPEKKCVMARYALDGTIKPRVTETIRFAEQVRKAILSQYHRRQPNQRSPILEGKENDQKLTGHQHAFFIPSDEDHDGWIDHVTIYAPSGFGKDEQYTLNALREINVGEGNPPIYTPLLGMGFLNSEVDGCVLWNESKVWISATPFLLNRHPKMCRGNSGQPKWRENTLPIHCPQTHHQPLGIRVNEQGKTYIQIDGPVDQLFQEWSHRQAMDSTLPDILDIEILTSLKADKKIRWIEFRRWRTNKPGPAISFGYGFRITFARPVQGPIALGYGCHFGMGTFHAERA